MAHEPSKATNRPVSQVCPGSKGLGWVLKTEGLKLSYVIFVCLLLWGFFGVGGLFLFSSNLPHSHSGLDGSWGKWEVIAPVTLNSPDLVFRAKIDPVLPPHRLLGEPPQPTRLVTPVLSVYLPVTCPCWETDPPEQIDISNVLGQSVSCCLDFSLFLPPPHLVTHLKSSERMGSGWVEAGSRVTQTAEREWIRISKTLDIQVCTAGCCQHG